jgi:hypothetical protein
MPAAELNHAADYHVHDLLCGLANFGSLKKPDLTNMNFWPWLLSRDSKPE